MGINHRFYDPQKHFIISNASCTTNCLAPMAYVLHQNFHIQYGIMTTIHSYTNDQRLLDLPHKDLRRARAAALNMIPTTTGAAKAIGLVIPELKGRLHGISIRVPTPNVSLVDFTFLTEKEISVDSIHKVFRESAENELRGILSYEERPLVSSDFNGDPHSCIFDATGTIVLSPHFAKVMGWYDNETGFSQRLVELFQMIASKDKN
jgi:glyceraldehyde 3-phosphate dehydrogenase